MLSNSALRILLVGGVLAGASASHALALAGGFSESTVFVNANGATLIEESDLDYFYSDFQEGLSSSTANTFGYTNNDGSKYMRSETSAEASPTGKTTGLYGHAFTFDFVNETGSTLNVTFDISLYREGMVSVDNQATEFASYSMYGGAAKYSSLGNSFDFRTEPISTTSSMLVNFSNSHVYQASFELAPDEEARFEIWASTEFSVEAVPEPASMGALALGSLALLKRRRKSA